MRRLRYGFIIIMLACAASLNAQQPARQSGTERAASSGVITGRVQIEGGQPVAGASVIALPAGLITNPSRMIASLFRPASTDDAGRFQLKELPEGAYLVHVMVPGYVMAPDASARRYLRPGDTTTMNLIKGGVITGKVTGPNGEPIVGARVQAIRVRDLENRPASDSAVTSYLSLMSSEFDWRTDDRGIYRIYGLEPGVFHVLAGGTNRMSYSPSLYDGDAPTYYPSDTADTAADVTVRAGEEATNVDIRYRGIAGHTISGAVSGPPALLANGVNVRLVQKSSGALAGTSFVLPGAQSYGFKFDAVGDGEYYVTAYAGSANLEDGIATSQSHAVTVKGSDVTGVNLTVEPLGAISGRVVIEQAQGADLKEKCKNIARSRLDEVVIHARAADRNRSDRHHVQLLDMYLSSVPTDKGEIAIRYVGAGRHHLDIDLPASAWYVRAITLPGSASASSRLNVARDGLNLRSGGRIEGLVITLAEGAASLKGRVVPAKEGVALPARLRVHLVPAEKEAADETLRYAEAVTKSDGTFEAHNLAPGRYWIVTRAMPDEESPENPPPPLAWESSGRAGLRFEGEAINTAIELKPCERISDFIVRHIPPLTSPSKKRGRQGL